MQTPLAYLETLAYGLVRGCTARTPGGVTLFTPDGVASYNALWLRDFSYMMEYAGESVRPDEAVGCVRFAIGGRREDGWMPDRIYANGRAIYAAGEAGKPVGRANLDNTSFLVFIVSDLLPRLPESEAKALFAEWAPALAQGLAVIPLSPAGLVYSDPTDPHSPYGFTDTVAKTGELMMESLLLWRACRKMEAMGARYTGAADPRWARMAEAIERNLSRLYDANSGMYLAATQDCRQIDIWGSAYAVYIGFPNAQRNERITRYLIGHYDEIVYAGQVRHLPGGEYWQKTSQPIGRDEYQNGAYWGTASGWVAYAIAQADPALASRMLGDLTDYFRARGVFECVNKAGIEKIDNYGATIANPLAAIRRMRGGQSSSQ